MKQNTRNLYLHHECVCAKKMLVSLLVLTFSKQNTRIKGATK